MNAKSFIDNTGRLVMAEALLIPTGFVSAVFLARALEPAGYGHFALISQFVIWIEMLLVAGLESATIQFVSLNRDDRKLINSVYLIYGGIGLTSSLLLMLLAPALAFLLKSSDFRPFIVLLSIDIPFFMLAHASRHIAAGTDNFRSNAVMRSVYWLTRLLFIIVFVSAGLSVKGALLALICASVSEMVLGFCLIRPKLLSGGFKSSLAYWKLLAPLQFAELNKRLLSLDIVLLKAMGGTHAATGLLGAAKNLSVAPVILSSALKPTLLANLSSDLSAGDHESARIKGIAILRLLCWLLPIVALTAASSEELIALIFGDAYLQAAPLFKLLIVSSIGFLTINMGLVFFTAWGRPRLSVQVTWPMLPVFAAVLIFTYSNLGVAAIALATLVAVSVSGILTLLMLHSQWRFHVPFLTILKASLTTLLLIALGYFWPANGVMVIVKLILGFLLWAGMLFMLSEFSAAEQKTVFSLIKSSRFSSQNGEL